jgi:pimeloyl-ACP methyl ester carboxylesterase
MRRPPLLPLLPFLLACLGCASLRPFEDVRRELPEDRFLRIGDQLVHVEMAGQGAPLVLLHGFGASTWAWRLVMPRLAESFRVIAVDLSGFGYTQRPRDRARYTREAQGELVLRVMETLGYESAHLMGHSYGGGITLWIAWKHPERVRSMVLVDSSAPTYAYDRRSRIAAFRPLTAAFLRSWMLRPAHVQSALLRSFYDDSKVTHELVQGYWERIRIEGVVDAYYGLTVPVHGPVDQVALEDIRVPALVVWGAQDQVISVEAGRQAAARMPQAEFAVIDRAGHIPMEERPEELLRLALPFLKRQAERPE